MTETGHHFISLYGVLLGICSTLVIFILFSMLQADDPAQGTLPISRYIKRIFMPPRLIALLTGRSLKKQYEAESAAEKAKQEGKECPDCKPKP